MKKVTLLSIFMLCCLPIFADGLQMAVVSDVHVMEPSLLQKDGKAFKAYLNSDRKMLAESADILEETTNKLLKEHPQYVLIPGDLTKDGEKISHEYLVKNSLERLRNAGIQALVIPGNHDVSNPHAVTFDGDTTYRVASVNADEFANIYNNYGYGKAISRDPNSLTYIYKLDDKTYLLAIDACKYEFNSIEKNTCTTSGRIKPETMQYIQTQLTEARKNGIRVIAMMHHGLIEHFKYQQKVLPEWLVDDWKKQVKALKKLGVEVCFTGHLHAQDAVCYNGVYDVQTGSLVSYPSPFRMVSLNDNIMTIDTEYISSIKGEPLTESAKIKTQAGFTGIIGGMFPKEISGDLRTRAASKLASSFIRNYMGDEKMTKEDKAEIKAISGDIRKKSLKWSIVFSKVCESLLTDINTNDNKLIIKLQKY